jgi:XTP/dITP diphosphohydrolase
MNPGKLREFALAAREWNPQGLSIEPLPGMEQLVAPEENGATFEENASIKAAYYSTFTPELIFAEDSGLEVDALGGAPGIYSARYAGSGATDAANNELLLDKLRGETIRTARFVCVIALANGGRILERYRGAVEGRILEAAAGTNGFGYDPLFFYPPLRLSFAQLSAKQKLTVSHRGQALGKLFAAVAKLPIQT